MVKLKALTRFPYAGRNLEVGDPFDASESDAHILILADQAERDGNRSEAETHHNANPVDKIDPRYQTRDMVAGGARGRGRGHSRGMS